MNRLALCGFFFIVLSACSGGDPAQRMAPTDPCAPIGRSENGVCVSELGFTAGPTLLKPRDHHGTAIGEVGGNAFLYVTGGTNYSGVFKDAGFAPIAADGSLGAFTAATNMSTTRAGHGTFVHGGRLFVVGGQGAAGFLASASSAPINADGSLGAWEAEPELGAARFHLGVVATDTHAYAIGGVSESALPFVAEKNVYVSAFQPDGHLGPWQAAADLPEPRSHHSLLLHDQAIYILGGLIEDTSNGGPMAHTVLMSKLGQDGTPGPWVNAGAFDDPVSTLASFELQGFAYAVGGLTEDDSYSARIRRAPFLADGTLGAFADLGALPEARSHVHQTPYRNGHLYTMGGSIDYQIVTDEVFVGTFAPPAAPTGLGASSLALQSAPTRKQGARCPCKLKARISIPK